MRNWNIALVIGKCVPDACLYRTYEELKRHALIHSQPIVISLYRTYEELKHGIVPGRFANHPSLYRTYEELKLLLSSRQTCRMILFVSYLWGIETCRRKTRTKNGKSSLYRTYEELKPRSLALATTSSLVRFVSYLWGIETQDIIAYLNEKAGTFVSYLWGIETPYGVSNGFKLLQVCIVPMRNWNTPLSRF